MTERLNIESKIRDWLADNLDFVAPNLSLLQKEFYLRDDIGASGFVDLLCKDAFHNFVVIEIKRSESSARQTISEILKYHALIKYNFNARESEIRTIVISTSWNELIRPFSETVYRTSLDLTGYLICIDVNYVPISISEVFPLERSSISRKFAYWQGLFMFESKMKQSAFYKDFAEYLSQKALKDYVLLTATADLSDRRVMFPFGVIVAFQQLSIDELLIAIRNLSLNEFKDLEYRPDFDGEHDYRKYLEGRMIDALDTLGHFHESEACYPKKFNVMMNAENWTIQDVQRFGLFSKDPRYTDELLINELTGLDGNNENEFLGFSESTQTEKIKEIQEECRYSLMQSSVWLNTINVILGRLRLEKRKFRLTIHIFNQTSLIATICQVLRHVELGYLPTYSLSIDFLDNGETEMYLGSIRWNGNIPTSPLLVPLSNIEVGSRVSKLYNDPDNELDSQQMNLGYTTARYSIVNGRQEFNGFYEGRDGNLVKVEDYLFSFEQFAVTHCEQLKILMANHNKIYVVM